MWTLVAFAIIFLLAGAAYIMITLLSVPGLAEERLGRPEPLPEKLGEWRDDVESDQGQQALDEGLQRQSRLWIDPAGDFLGRERLLRQVRYVDRETGEVVRSDPDRRVRRPRVRQ